MRRTPRLVTAGWWMLGALACAAVASRAGAQQCDSVVSRTSLAEMNGRVIRSVNVETREPPSLPLAPALIDRLHVRTRDATIRRLVQFAPADTVDSLRVAESLRRLRKLRYLTDIAIVASTCDEGSVDLTVATKDLWSARPSLQVRSTSQALSFTERNVFGTGREVSVGVRSDVNGVAPSLGFRDPWFLGRDLSLDLLTSGDGERGVHSALIQKRERSILDRVGLEARVRGSSFDSDPFDTSSARGISVESLRRLSAGAFLSRRALVSQSAVTHLVIGSEYDRLAWERPYDGPTLERREFIGGSLGARRRSIAYDTVTWYLPDQALVDIPLAVEYDALVSVGRDLTMDAPSTHVDAWLGKMWLLDRRSLLIADAWGSGYQTRGVWSGATLRGALSYQRAATRGLWSVRVGGERWYTPDPDLRSVVVADPTLRVLGAGARHSTRAFVASVERSVHLKRLTRSYTLDGALFGAMSTRTEAGVGAVGFGARLAPTRLGRVTARLDVGFPVSATGDVRRRPFIAIGITPWLEQDRERDGRRVR